MRESCSHCTTLECAVCLVEQTAVPACSQKGEHEHVEPAGPTFPPPIGQLQSHVFWRKLKCHPDTCTNINWLSMSCWPRRPVLGTGNMTSLMGKGPGLRAWDVEWYQVAGGYQAVGGFTSMHCCSSGTRLLERGWTCQCVGILFK